MPEWLRELLLLVPCVIVAWFCVAGADKFSAAVAEALFPDREQ